MPSPYTNWTANRRAEINAIRNHVLSLQGRFAFFHIDGAMYLRGADTIGNLVFVVGPKPEPRSSRTLTAHQLRTLPYGGCWPVDCCPTSWARLTGAPVGDRSELNNAIHLAASDGAVPGYTAGPIFTGGGTVVPTTGSALPAYPAALGMAPTIHQLDRYRDLLRGPDPAPPAESARPEVVVIAAATPVGKSGFAKTRPPETIASDRARMGALLSRFPKRS